MTSLHFDIEVKRYFHLCFIPTINISQGHLLFNFVRLHIRSTYWIHCYTSAVY